MRDSALIDDSDGHGTIRPHSEPSWCEGEVRGHHSNPLGVWGDRSYLFAFPGMPFWRRLTWSSDLPDLTGTGRQGRDAPDVQESPDCIEDERDRHTQKQEEEGVVEKNLSKWDVFSWPTFLVSPHPLTPPNLLWTLREAKTTF